MRRILILFLLTIFTFTACSDKSSSGGEYLISAGQSVYDDGMFYFSFSDACLHFLDFGSVIDLPVCARPNCTHDNDSCSSKGFGGTPIIHHGKSLYWFVNEVVWSDSGNNAVNRCTIYKCDETGANRMKLCELPKDIAVEEAIMFLKDDILYFIGGNQCPTSIRADERSKWVLYSYDFGNNDLKEIIEICDQYNSNAAIDGMFDGKLYMFYQGFEEYKPASERTFEDYAKARRFVYYSFEDNAIFDAEYERLCLSDGYYVSVAPNGVRITLPDGSSAVAEKFEPQEMYMYSVVNGKLFCGYNGAAFDPKSSKYYKLKGGEIPVAYRNGKYIISSYSKDGLRTFSALSEEELFVGDWE